MNDLKVTEKQFKNADSGEIVKYYEIIYTTPNGYDIQLSVKKSSKDLFAALVKNNEIKIEK